MKDFLPVTIEDMEKRGWDRPDFVYVIGDAYVDHSSFGPAIISRVLEANGYKVAMIPQPDFRNAESIAVFGRPRYAFLVSAGNMDSMVNHYTSAKKKRSEDLYSPGGRTGLRPDMPTVVYTNLIRKGFKDVPVIAGGIEASLRRLAHYDYRSDKIRRSILLDSGADLLVYGMGELSIVQVADALAAGIAVSDITFVPGTVYKTRDVSPLLKDAEEAKNAKALENGSGKRRNAGTGSDGNTAVMLPSFDEVSADKAKYAESFRIQSENTDPITAGPLIEKYGNNRYIVQNTPMRPLTTQEMDDIYELPYMNAWHPMYDSLGGVPAFKDVRFSLTSNRGCFGGCSFCALSFHQGRIVQARSHESLLREAAAMTKEKDFKGYIYDVGGPTADFRQPACRKQMDKGVCKNRQCLYPKPCKNLIADHSDYISLLGKLRKLPGVKKVFIRSGIRFDYVLADKSDEFLRVLCRHHISGQLRVAPEHVSSNVLRLMGKPENGVYKEFVRRFDKINKETGKQQYVLPYLISSHPGSTLEDAVMLAESIRDMGYMPEQVQDFYPTPSTVSTCMYYTGLDPRTMEKVYVPKNAHEKAMQRALMQYRRPENYELVKEALLKCGRADLIGFDRDKCLIPPRKIKNGKDNEKAENAKNIKPQRRQGDTRRTADAGERRRNKGRRRA